MADHVPYRSKGSYSLGQCKYYVNKTALNVITLLLPVLDALVANRKDETLSIHETKINRLQVGVRKNEYASDALDQYSRRENVRITGIPEGEGMRMIQLDW